MYDLGSRIKMKRIYRGNLNPDDADTHSINPSITKWYYAKSKEEICL